MGVSERRGNQLAVQVAVVVVVVVFTFWAVLFDGTRKHTRHFAPKEVREKELAGWGEDGGGGRVEAGEGAARCPPPKRILAWTTFWRQYSFAWEKIFFRQVSRQCPESRCELVYEHQLLDSVDAVLFHPPDMAPAYALPKTRPPGQPWIFFSLESPSTLESQVKLSNLSGVFNWTMTYRRDSDIVVPYGVITPRPVTPGPDKDYWARKSQNKFVAWAVSHCNTASRREWFVKELVKHISVDVYGRCGSKKCGRNLSYKWVGTFNQTECNTMIEGYMFYLAFENSICQDYITEKFYQALTLDVIPVVLGGGDYLNEAPPHSYIDALAFPSPKKLAEYLKRVAENREAYNRYFAWKPYYTVELGHPFLPFVCDLCAKLHDPASLALPNVTRSASERAGVVGVTRGRDGNGSYPDMAGWFSKASGCRRWWKDSHDHKTHSHTNR